jgi:ABC-type bacteriocin/lantibiotic exporter with double-glycine peptidase domain
VRPYWSRLSRGFALSFVGATIALVPPYLSKLYFDNVYPARDTSLMHVLVLGVAVFTLASALMGALRGYYTQVVSSTVGSAVGLMYFNHLQHLPIRFFEEHRVGEIMSRAGDMRSALGAVSRVFQTLLVSSVYLILVPPFLAALNWKLTVVALITAPVTAVISTASSRMSRKFMKRAAESGAELSATQIETFNHIRTLKAMALERDVFRDVAAQVEQTLHLQLKTSAVGTLVGLSNALVRTIGSAVFAWYAWTLILEGSLSLGTFIAFSAYLGYLIGPVGQVTELFADFQQLAVTLGRAFEYLDLAPEQSPEEAYWAPTPIRRRLLGAVGMNSVTFGYKRDQPVLKNVSIEFPQGSVTALVGPSGAGKSTILRLLCGMEHPWSGSIGVDGVALEQIGLSDLRRQMAVVWQEPALLRGTVWENLTLGATNPSIAAVDDAVDACQLGQLIRDLPEGYNTIVAEWGATLSGGQRQRFALARALVRDTPILLLDELTSQVDARTEEDLLRELLLRVRGKTVVLITHRMLTASAADRVCVLENGELLRSGSSDEIELKLA